MKKRFIAVATSAALLVGGAAAAIPAGTAHAQSTRCDRLNSQLVALTDEINFLEGQPHLTRTQQLFLQAAIAQRGQVESAFTAANCVSG